MEMNKDTESNIVNNINDDNNTNKGRDTVYELTIKLKRAKIKGIFLGFSYHVIICIDGKECHRTNDVTSLSDWNESIVRRFNEIERIGDPIMISLSLYKRKLTSTGYSLIGTAHINCNDLIGILNTPGMQRDYPLDINRHTRDLITKASLLVSLKLKVVPSGIVPSPTPSIYSLTEMVTNSSEYSSSHAYTLDSRSIASRSESNGRPLEQRLSRSSATSSASSHYHPSSMAGLKAIQSQESSSSSMSGHSSAARSAATTRSVEDKQHPVLQKTVAVTTTTGASSGKKQIIIDLNDLSKKYDLFLLLVCYLFTFFYFVYIIIHSVNIELK